MFRKTTLHSTLVWRVVSCCYNSNFNITWYKNDLYTLYFCYCDLLGGWNWIQIENFRLYVPYSQTVYPYTFQTCWNCHSCSFLHSRKPEKGYIWITGTWKWDLSANVWMFPIILIYLSLMLSPTHSHDIPHPIPCYRPSHPMLSPTNSHAISYPLPCYPLTNFHAIPSPIPKLSLTPPILSTHPS